MKFARLLVDGSACVARLEDDLLVPVAVESDSSGPGEWFEWSAADAARRPSTGASIPVSEAHFLPAVRNPEKIICVGLNYRDHATESKQVEPEKPLLFSKTNNTLLGHCAEIWSPSDLTAQADYEVELAVVIGTRTSRVSPDRALDHVFGYTVANDVSARDAQFSDGQWMRGKNFDTFCPIGPYLTTADSVADVQNLAIRTYLNGQVMQEDNTTSMIFPVTELISYVSRYLTLVPGDVILTGTPAGVGFAREPAVFLRDSDTIEVEIDGLGRLTNTVTTKPAFSPVEELVS